MGARPVWYRAGSYPRMLRLPTSLPGGNPGGTTAARPSVPRRASAASTGMAAASSGVRPPSSSTGSSAQPSGTHTTNFTGPGYGDASTGSRRAGGERLHHGPDLVDVDVH